MLAKDCIYHVDELNFAQRHTAADPSEAGKISQDASPEELASSQLYRSGRMDALTARGYYAKKNAFRSNR